MNVFIVIAVTNTYDAGNEEIIGVYSDFGMAEEIVYAKINDADWHLIREYEVDGKQICCRRYNSERYKRACAKAGILLSENPLITNR